MFQVDRESPRPLTDPKVVREGIAETTSPKASKRKGAHGALSRKRSGPYLRRFLGYLFLRHTAPSPRDRLENLLEVQSWYQDCLPDKVVHSWGNMKTEPMVEGWRRGDRSRRDLPRIS